MANVQGRKPRSPHLRFAAAINSTTTIVYDASASASNYMRDQHPPEALLQPSVAVSDSSQQPESAAASLAHAAAHEPMPAVLAVSVDWGEARIWSLDYLPPHYGHIWGFMYAFWQSFVAPRLHQSRQGLAPPPWVTVVLPAGPHVGWPHGGTAFWEIEQLWSSNATRLRIERAPWVPICLRQCCWSDGTPPSAAMPPSPRSMRTPAVMLLQHFPAHSLRYDRWRQFRHDAWQSLGLHSPPRPVLSSTTGRIVWAVAASGSNKRTLRRESEVIRAVRGMLAVERPSWQLLTLDSPSASEASIYSYVDQLRTVASASIFISLCARAETDTRLPMHVSAPSSTCAKRSHAADSARRCITAASSLPPPR